MSAPALAVNVQGLGQVSADNLNTYAQGCDTIGQLRAFVGIQGIQVFVRGTNVPNDGGQGNFYWNPSGTGPDNNYSVIVPTGAASGAWNRLAILTSGPLVLPYSYQVPVTGFSITVPNGVSALILNPVGVLSTGTITLPAAPLDGQPVALLSSQVVTTLTILANTGQSITGAATSVGPTTQLKYTYAAPVKAWFRGG